MRNHAPNTASVPAAGRAAAWIAALCLLVLAAAGPAMGQTEYEDAFRELQAETAGEPEIVTESVSEFAPEPTPMAMPAAVPAGQEAFDYGAVDLRAALWLDRDDGEVYRKGEELEIGFQASDDAYAVVYRIDTEGLVTVLWPRSRMDDGFVFGGHEYVLPVKGARRLRVATAEGEGFVEAIVSSYPFDLRGLEIDFHHEPAADRLDFRVAGDPFLAMNEVNFAVTGLEDPGDYVVTNYVSYYVHRTVDHPRYLCSQCHFEDDVDYHPYRDTCRMDITVDHTWSNAWWDRYGYYPVYSSPVFVYVDPWTWRPWINFWYDPWWRTPAVSVCVWNGPVGVWATHDRYAGNCNTRWRTGRGHYRPLAPEWGGETRRKTREYGQITTMVAAGGGRGRSGTGTKTGRDAYAGESRVKRQRPVIEDRVRTRSDGGLRIRRGGGLDTGKQGGRVRHDAGGTSRRAGLVPVSRTGRDRANAPKGGAERGASRVRNPRPAPERRGEGRTEDRTIRTVDPRKKGTRIWNSERGSAGGSRGQNPQKVRRGRSGGKDQPDRAAPQTPNRRKDGGSTSRGTRTGSSKTGGSRSKQSDSGGSKVKQAPKKSSDSGRTKSGGGSRTKRSGGRSRR